MKVRRICYYAYMNERTNDEKIAQAKGRILFHMRQADGGPLPIKFPMTPFIAELVDTQTAQKIYEELIAELEANSGRKMERSDK